MSHMAAVALTIAANHITTTIAVAQREIRPRAGETAHTPRLRADDLRHPRVATVVDMVEDTAVAVVTPTIPGEAGIGLARRRLGADTAARGHHRHVAEVATAVVLVTGAVVAPHIRATARVVVLLRPGDVEMGMFDSSLCFLSTPARPRISWISWIRAERHATSNEESANKQTR